MVATVSVLPLGPWVLPVSFVAILLGWFAASAVAAFLHRRGWPDAASGLWVVLLAALIAGRTAFVVRWWQAYRASPWWSVFDLRDSGFDPLAACVTLAVVVVLMAWRRPRLRRPLPISVASGLAATALTLLIAMQLQASSHPPLAYATLRRLDGTPVQLTALRGKPMAINLWTTWCPPCRAELPMLVAASRTLPDVRFVFVDQGEPAATVKAFLERENLVPRHVLLDDQQILSADYRVLGYPTTLFVDASGRLQDTHVGPLSRATLAQHLLRITSPTRGASR